MKTALACPFDLENPADALPAPKLCCVLAAHFDLRKKVEGHCCAVSADFASAPKYHSGGILERMDFGLIGEPGEIFFPKKQTEIDQAWEQHKGKNK